VNWFGANRNNIKEVAIGLVVCGAKKVSASKSKGTVQIDKRTVDGANKEK